MTDSQEGTTTDISTDIETPHPRPARPNFLTDTRFDQFKIPDEIIKGLNENGLIHCTPIQARSIGLAIEGRDIAGQAQTGTGKTAAFLVPTLTALMEESDTRTGLPSALIIAPTRELALQIYEDAQVIGKYTDLTMTLVIGGIDYKKQADELKKKVDIVICTPGRLIDYMKQGVFKPTKIKVLIIDEADRLLDMGFIKDLRYIMGKLPGYEKRQTMLFSATLSGRILELTYDFMNVPEFISMTPDEVIVESVDQSLFHVGKDEKLSLLLGLLEKEDWTRALIFVNTKIGAERLTHKLIGNGHPAKAITGDLPQKQRLDVMKKFKEGKIKILVATDVASRGIHVDDISHVFNYDLPQDVENYVHRIGRTARQGKDGRAISMACEDFIYHLLPLEEFLNYRIPVKWPQDDWFKEDVASDLPRKRSGRERSSSSGGRGKKPGGKPEPRPKATPKPLLREGGIFGLAPPSRQADGKAGEEEEVKKKKKKKRRRKKPAAKKETTSA